MTTHKHDAADSATAASNSGEAVRPAKKRYEGDLLPGTSRQLSHALDCSLLLPGD